MRSKLLLTLLLLLLTASPLAAQNLDLDEMAAALALPIVTGGHDPQHPWKLSGDTIISGDGAAVTLITVTNGLESPILLKIDLIDGDPAVSAASASWRSTSFTCLLTGRETTTFLFRGAGGGTSEVYVECSNSFGQPDPRAFFTGVQNGIFFAAVADPVGGTVISQDVIWGDAVVVDAVGGQAYGVGAIAFQSGQGMNDGDKVYRFNGLEYARFPSVLASNFIAPTADGDVEAELILFTLDGTAGSVPVPRAMLGGFVFNDDEQSTDFQYVFDCFDIVSLADIDQNFVYLRGSVLGLGSPSGHMVLVSQPTSTANDVHDAQYGDGNDSRTRPVHGWIVQSVAQGGRVMAAGDPIAAQVRNIPAAGMSGNAAWARPLTQSRTAVRPFQGDQNATFDADPTI